MTKRTIFTVALTLVGLTFAACESGGSSQTRGASAESEEAEADSPDQQSQMAGGSDEQSGEAPKGGEIPDPVITRPGDKIAAGDVPPVGSTLELTEEEWRERLGEERFHILREEGTERAGSGELLKTKEKGIYYCAGCGAPLFSSQTKFKSGTGWPSFYSPYEEGRVALKVDDKFQMRRIEVECARCGGHLGHVFDDGPEPTGKRYCINSLALKFESADEIEASGSTDDSTDAGAVE